MSLWNDSVLIAESRRGAGPLESSNWAPSSGENDDEDLKENRELRNQELRIEFELRTLRTSVMTDGRKVGNIDCTHDRRTCLCSRESPSAGAWVCPGA